jgi:hypothetical protein
VTDRKRFEDDPPYRHEHAPWDGPAVGRNEEALRRFEARYGRGMAASRAAGGSSSAIKLVLFVVGCSVVVAGVIAWWLA